MPKTEKNTSNVEELIQQFVETLDVLSAELHEAHLEIRAAMYDGSRDDLKNAIDLVEYVEARIVQYESEYATRLEPLVKLNNEN